MNEYLARLTEERQKVWHEMKALADRATDEKRSLDAAERESWDKMNDRLDTADAEIRGIVERIERETAADEVRARIPGLSTPAAPAAEYDNIRDLFNGEKRAVNYHVDGDLAKSLYERRAVTTGSTSGGKTIPPSTMVHRLYEELINASNIFGASTILTTATGEPLDFPVVKAASDSTDAKILAGDASMPSTEANAMLNVAPVFNKVTITPAKYGVLLQISSELAQDTVVDLEGYIARSAAAGIKNNASKDFVATVVAGAGSASVAWADFAAIYTTGSGYTNLVDLAYSVNPQYRPNGSWLLHDQFVKNVRKLTDSQSRPVWEPSAQAGQPDLLLGFPIVVDPNMATSGAGAKVAVFGDLSTHTIRQVADLRFEASTDFAFDSDLLTYRCIWRGGSAVLDTQSLKYGTITA